MTTIVPSRGEGSQNWTKFGQRNFWMAPVRLECPWHWWKTPMYLVRWLFYQDRWKPWSKGAIAPSSSIPPSWIWTLALFKLGFPKGRDSTLFQDKGTEVPLLSRDKETTGQAQNLAKGRDGPGQPKPGTGRAGTAKIRDGTRDKTGQSRKGCSKTV